MQTERQRSETVDRNSTRGADAWTRGAFTMRRMTRGNIWALSIVVALGAVVLAIWAAA